MEREPKDPFNDLIVDVGRGKRPIEKLMTIKNTDFPELVQKSCKMNKQYNRQQ